MKGSEINNTLKGMYISSIHSLLSSYFGDKEVLFADIIDKETMETVLGDKYDSSLGLKDLDDLLKNEMPRISKTWYDIETCNGVTILQQRKGQKNEIHDVPNSPIFISIILCMG